MLQLRLAGITGDVCLLNRPDHSLISGAAAGRPPRQPAELGSSPQHQGTGWEIREDEKILVPAPSPGQVPAFGTPGVTEGTKAALVEYGWHGF